MGSNKRSTAALSAIILFLLFVCPVTHPVASQLSPSALGAETAGALQVKFDKGNTEIDSVQSGVKFSTNRALVFNDVPPELVGLNFTRRTWAASTATLDVPAGMTVYAIIANGPAAASSRDKLVAAGWTQYSDLHLDETGKNGENLIVYERPFAKKTHEVVQGRGVAGISFVASVITLVETAPPAGSTATPSSSPQGTGETLSNKPEVITGSGPTTRISKEQTSIKGLYVIEQENSDMLGICSDYILTATPGSGPTEVSFTVPVGAQMQGVLKDVLRSIRVKYPNWAASKVELSFEERDVAHDGPSIGAATGTLLLSMIEGFDIDPDLAMTGDVTADGKVRAIGGVSAKLRGATAAGATIVAIPEDNFDQVEDTMIYSGLPAITQSQIIGIANLKDAEAVARIDRDKNLEDAMNQFADVQNSMKKSLQYIHTHDAQDKLQRIVSLYPQHLSAKLLLMVAQGRQRHHLTAGASEYYTFVAVETALPALFEQQKANVAVSETPIAVADCLKNLHQVRPMADTQIQPLVDAWSGFITAWSDYQSRHDTADDVEQKRQALIDEMAKLNADRALTEKMLHEGV